MDRKRFPRAAARAGVDTVIITGGETDVCVLATVIGAVDWGFRVILVTDALCSSADETHDSMMNIYMNRFGQQVECVTTETLLESWPGSAGVGLMRQTLCRADFLPKEPGDGQPFCKEWFEGFLKELTEVWRRDEFVRAPGQGLWRSGNETERDTIAVVEVMAESRHGILAHAAQAAGERALPGRDRHPRPANSPVLTPHQWTQ